jgi:predicted  nucleic acid-binding Zn-ribbon protein
VTRQKEALRKAHRQKEALRKAHVRLRGELLAQYETVARLTRERDEGRAQIATLTRELDDAKAHYALIALIVGALSCGGGQR